MLQPISVIFIFLFYFNILKLAKGLQCATYDGLQTVMVSTYDQLECAFDAKVPNITVNASIYFSQEIYISGSQYHYNLFGTESASLSNQGQRLFNISSSSLALYDLALQGQYPAISGTNYGGLFYISDSKLSFYNSTISKGSASCGAALYSSNSTISIFASEVTSNIASSTGQCGGAFHIVNTDIKVNCTLFNGNSGSTGGAIFSDSSRLSVYYSNFSDNIVSGIGAALFMSSSDGYILQSNFVDNLSSFHGGALGTLIATNLSLQTVSCKRNSANNFGGCLYGSDSSIRISESDISLNKGGDGGGLYILSGSLQIFETSINENNADSSGAALVCGDNALVFSVSTLFSSNLAVSIGGSISVQGGCSVLLGNSSITNSTVIQSGSPISIGGGINCQYGTVQLQYTNMSYNSASQGSEIYSFYCNVSIQNSFIFGSQSGDGSIYSVGSILSFLDSAILNNTGSTSCAGIYCLESISCKIERSNFRFNTASELGVVAIDTTPANITSCNFEENLSYGLAGAIYLINSDVTAVMNCTFARNVASTYGGAIAVEIFSFLELKHSIFVKNQAVAGGAIYGFHFVSITTTNTAFISNKGFNTGGAIYVGDHVSYQADTINVQNCSSSSGGAIYATYLTTLDIFNFVCEGNSAGYAGGGMSLFNGVRLKLSKSKFLTNQANIGGALSLEYQSSVTLQSSNFIDNTAESYGGVGYALIGSSVEMLSCNVSSNVGLFGGGGWFVQSSSINVTSSNFDKNDGIIGSAIYMLGSKSLLQGNLFQSNGVGCLQGGAIYGAASSDINSLDNRYIANAASQGGVFAIYRSTLYSEADLITACVATIGSCVFVMENSSITMVRTEVSHNDEQSLGTTSEQVYIDGSNLLIVEGLFAYNYVSSSGALGLYSSSAVIKNTSFVHNLASEANARGGAVHVACSTDCVSSLDLHLEILNCSFYNNTASLGYGGAVYANSFPGHIDIIDTNFANNSATFGGALASDDVLINVSSSIFFYNQASVGGGAIFWTFVNGEDVIISSNNVFEFNQADYGPIKATSLTKLNVEYDSSTIQVSGQVLTTPVNIYLLDYYSQIVTQSLINQNLDTTIYCAILNDTGIVKGSTIVASNRGVASFQQLVITGVPGGNSSLQFSAPISTINPVEQTISFRLCQGGEITSSAGDGFYTCENCTLGTYSFYPADTECHICPAHATCPGGNVMILDEKYWRVDQYSASVLECSVSGVCLGGSNTLTQCAQGQTGPYCSVCEDEYTQNQNGECYSCHNSSDVGTEALATSLFILSIIVTALAMKYRRKLSKWFSSLAAKVDKVTSNRKFHTLRVKAKILVAFCQIIYELGPALSIVFPSNFSAYVSYYSLLQLSVINLPNISCIVQTNYYDQLLMSTLSPFVLFFIVSAVIQLLVIRAKRLNERNPSYTAHRALRDTINAAFVISYFVLVNVSTKIFQVFQCETFDDGESYLVADYSINCNSPERSAYLAYGIFMIFIYPIGIPLVYAVVLIRNQNFINPDWRKVIDAEEKKFVSNRVIQKEKIKVRNSYDEIENIKLLFDSYVPKRWYFELFDSARRLLLGAVPVLIFRGSSLQIIIVLLISLCSVATFMYFNPYIHVHDNNLAILAQWSITLVLISALIIKIQALSGGSNDNGLGIVLVLINIMVIIVAIGTTIMNSKERKDETTADEEGKGEREDEANDEGKEEEDLGSEREEEASVDSDDETDEEYDAKADQDDRISTGIFITYGNKEPEVEKEIEMNPLHRRIDQGISKTSKSAKEDID